MSNVLPPQVRKRVFRMYAARFITVGSLVLLAVALLASFALVPSYLALHIGESAPAAQSTAGVSQQSDRDAVVHAQALLSTLSPLLTATTTTSLVEDAIAERPAGIAVYHVSTVAGHPGTILISGTASSIEAISTYQSVLRADSHFTGVSVPVADLAGTGNGQFSVTLSANF